MIDQRESRARSLPVLNGPSSETDAEPLPPLYARWLSELLGEPLERERHATCASCAMCDPNGVQAHSGRYMFDPAVKCCSYLPVLPNFLVGGILKSWDALPEAGRTSVRNRMAEAGTSTPLGLGRSAQYRLLYEAAQHAVFGRSVALVCPHFAEANGGQCTIWEHRNAACSTWFCKHTRGALGKGVWDAARDLLRTVERDLSIWCAVQLGCDSVAVIESLERETNSPASQVGSELLSEGLRADGSDRWKSWSKDLDAYYASCASLVEPLSWSEVVAVCGAEVQLRASALKRARDSTDLPPSEYLAVGDFVARPGPDGTMVLATYSYTDPIVLSRRVTDLLHRFDGKRQTVEVLGELLAEGIELDERLLQRLVDFGVLRQISRAGEMPKPIAVNRFGLSA